MKNKINRWICLLAGAMDAGTGLLLVAVPDLALTLMQLAVAEASVAYLQFIGAFVFAVGTLYFAAWRLANRERLIEFRILWLVTAWIRLCVGLIVSVLIASGSLELGWISVPIADLGLGIYQISSGWRKISE